MIPALLLLPAVFIDAAAQGFLNRLTRRYVPPTEQAAVNLPLHYLYPWLYVLLTVAVGVNWDGPTIYLDVWAVAVLLRVAFFDAVVNWANKAPLFAVGSSANLDKILRKLTPGSEGRVASAVLRGAAVAGILLLLWV